MTSNRFINDDYLFFLGEMRLAIGGFRQKYG